jgi:hypothetical protein
VGEQSVNWVKNINPALLKVLTSDQLKTHDYK